MKADNLGFIAIGLSRAGPPLFLDRFHEWISGGKQADMAWMARHGGLREDPSRLLEGCRTVISLAYPYSSRKPCTPEGLSVSRHSEPDMMDYHVRLREKAGLLARYLEGEEHPGARTRVCVDSAPILERSFAYRSGIGAIGKNTQLIVPGHGSYCFLAEILTTAPLQFPEPSPLGDPCGSCTRCLDACPAGALEAPYRLNAARCLSYQTIERKEGVDTATGQRMGTCFFGCDVCQEVCPLNKKEEPRVNLPPIAHILSMDERMFRATYGKSALARAGLQKIKSNIRAMTMAQGSRGPVSDAAEG